MNSLKWFDLYFFAYIRWCSCNSRTRHSLLTQNGFYVRRLISYEQIERNQSIATRNKFYMKYFAFVRLCHPCRLFIVKRKERYKTECATHVLMMVFRVFTCGGKESSNSCQLIGGPIRLAVAVCLCGKWLVRVKILSCS